MRGKKRKFRRQLVTLGTAAAAAAIPTSSRAEGMTFGAGVFIGYASGSRSGVEWGFETFFTQRLQNACSGGARTGVGSNVQLGLIDWGQPRLTVAAHGGGEYRRSLLAFSGELGATYRFGSKETLDLHLGIVPEVSFFNLAMRYQALSQDTALSLGARFMPTYGAPGDCYRSLTIPGRPLRSGDGFLQATAAHREEAVQPGSRERIAELGLAWERDAQLECASIPAFYQLATELAWHGAPARLIERAFEAASDEAFHAQACASMASAHLGAKLTPVLPDVAPRPILPAQAGLIRLAVESWLDGCLNEARAARQAAVSAELPGEENACALQRRIAADEQRHADLAWDVLRWSLAQGGESVREALRVCRDVDPMPAADADAPVGFERYGRLGALEIDRIAHLHTEQARARLDGIIQSQF